jgi:cellulose synthase/poly-beta-1,6-N-acetylglucosamine synthase-like glycosyltransferase
MKTLEIIFWIALSLIFYTYLGYGIALYIMLSIKRLFRKKPNFDKNYIPEVTLLVAAYNEEEYVAAKIRNSFQLDYPQDKITHIWVTDGSNDNTNSMLESYHNVQVLYNPERKGKISAINRAMQHIQTPIVIFTDANTMLGEKSVRKIVELFSDPKTGCVSGEKRIANEKQADAAAAGEGIYWKYESMLKKWDAELNTAVGAAGELFAIRTELFEPVGADTLLDDFIISLRTAMKGYKIQYSPEAYAIEGASANVKEELKRKVRIAAGGIQSILRLLPLLNILKYKMLSFQYISHRVLRWTFTPLSLLIALISNIILISYKPVYEYFFYAQSLFYFTAFLGWLTQHFKIKAKLLFVPFYFYIMNYAVFKGFIRFLGKNQSVVWAKAKRA